MPKAPPRPAAPLATPDTGDKAFDEAAFAIQREFLDDSKPHIKAAFARLTAGKPGDDARLASLLVGEVFDWGPAAVWDVPAATKGMKPNVKKAWLAENAAANAAHMNRERYCGWLMLRLAQTAVGCGRLIDFMLDGNAGTIAKTLGRADAAAAPAALARRFPPAQWKQLVELDVPALIAPIAEQLVRDHGDAAFDTLAPHARDAAYLGGVLAGVDRASRAQGYGRFGDPALVKPQPIDARWIPIALDALSGKDDPTVVAAIEVLRDARPDAAWKPAVAKVAKRLGEYGDGVGAQELLEAIDAVAAVSPAPTVASAATPASTGPLPPLPRGKAPAAKHPKLPRFDAVTKRIDDMLAAASLAARRAKLVKPAFHVLTKRVKDDAIAVGASKVGGLPDLPAGTAWPEHAGVAMSFIAQFDLAAVAKVERSELPAKGLLSIFVDDEPFGDHYLEAATVLYVAKPAKLARTAPPPTFQAARAGKPARTPYATCEVTLVPTLTVPSSSHPVVAALADAERTRYAKHVTQQPHHLAQLLGFREHGYDASNPATATLLFRITSDGEADMTFGDEDPLDIYVPAAGLAKGDFRKAYPYCGD